MTEEIFISKLKEAYQMKIQCDEILSEIDGLIAWERRALAGFGAAVNTSRIKLQIREAQGRWYHLDRQFFADIDDLLKTFFDKPQ